jgi:rSAM/selenodomain-associated transferase 2
MLSIIVPALREAANLARLLPALRAAAPGAEIIVADAGSDDGTREVAARVPGVTVLTCERGRARQMNAGARAARGDALLFVHADTALPTGFEAAIARALADPGVVAGRFDVRLDNPRWPFRMIASLMNLRSRLSGISTGDQALFVRRDAFEALGGFPDIPLMEDIEITRRLKRRGRQAALRERVTTSARKWEREGVARTIGLMWTLRFLYACGVSPARLHRWYYRNLALAAAALLLAAGGGARAPAAAQPATSSGWRAAAVELLRSAPPSAPDALPSGWHLVTFRGITRHTRYAVVRDDAGWALHAQSEAAAAGLYRPLDLDPRAYPTISWRWRISRVLDRGDSTRKAGDDYPARVYVAFAYQPEREGVWERAKFEFYRAFYGEYPPGSVINYVWESRLPPETIYPNPYTARARMVVVRSGADQVGRWVAERRDFLADYRRLFGVEPPRLVGVALMTDTDDTGERAEAWYDAVTLHP